MGRGAAWPHARIDQERFAEGAGAIEERDSFDAASRFRPVCSRRRGVDRSGNAGFSGARDRRIGKQTNAGIANLAKAVVAGSSVHRCEDTLACLAASVLAVGVAIGVPLDPKQTRHRRKVPGKEMTSKDMSAKRPPRNPLCQPKPRRMDSSFRIRFRIRAK